MNTNFYKDILKSLNKLAVFIVLKEKNDKQLTYLVTRNANLINDFNSVFSTLEYKFDIDEQYIEAYELRYDKVVRIDISEVTHFTFFGIPDEVPPPIFLSEQFEHLLTEEQLHSFQRGEFLQKVKREKEAGHYDVEHPHSVSDIRKLHSIRYFLKEEFDIDVNDHPLFEFFDNHYRHYNMASDALKGRDILAFFKNANFLPAIAACQDLERSQIKQLISQGIDISTIEDLKEKWTAYLYKKRDEILRETISDRENIDSIYHNNLKEKITSHVPDAELVLKSIQEKQSIIDEYIALIAEHPSDKKSFNDWELMYQDPLHWNSEGHTDTQDAIVTTKEIFTGCTIESVGFVCKTIVDSFKECDSVKQQYDLIINQLQNINIEDELSLYNDYRLYLRYWPEIFPNNETFHAGLRPFSPLENKVIKLLISMGVEIDCETLYRHEWDYYNSCIDILQEHINICREKRLQHIKGVAAVRAEQIKDEMKPLIDNLSDDEKTQLENVMSDLVNYDNYKKDLESADRLIDVLSYWPVSLYPTPTSVLVV